MPVAQRPKILRRIIITHRITLLMIHLIRIGTAQSHTPIIILNRPLAPMPVTIQYQSANPRPIRIKPALTLTKPNHTNPTKKKQGWPVLSRRANQREKQPTAGKVLRTANPSASGGNRTLTSQDNAFLVRRVYHSATKAKENRQSPRHTHPNHGDCLSSNSNRHKEIQWQKMAFYRQPRRADAEGVEPPDRSRSPP